MNDGEGKSLARVQRRVEWAAGRGRGRERERIKEPTRRTPRGRISWNNPLYGRNVAYRKVGEHPLPRHFLGEITKQGQNFIPRLEEKSIRCNRDGRTGALIPSPDTSSGGVGRRARCGQIGVSLEASSPSRGCRACHLWFGAGCRDEGRSVTSPCRAAL